MHAYDHKKIEKKWQKKWERQKIYRAGKESGDKSQKCYVLDMFPYPSGEGLHVGHPKGYIATDIYSRFKRMNGHNVLHPMGWDAFGLPAENFAIKNKVHPRTAVEKNIARFKEQLAGIGFDYDWSREINTTDPAFYKWTQWIFLKMLERGLAYQSHEPINWCPSCQTGLANEDVEGGRCERCGSATEKRPMRQWVLKITDYAERLLGDLGTLNWPESIKETQRNWIGKSEGAEIDFKIKSTRGSFKVKIFTTRADTIFGATYLVVAPEHELLARLKGEIKNWKEIEKYIAAAKTKTEIERTAEGREKTGARLEGIKALNPANGEEIDVWVADYVLAHYGTGAVMAVPAHDERDFEFAKKYNLPIKHVVMPSVVDKGNPPQPGKENTFRKLVLAMVHDPKTNKYLCLKWKEYPWTTFITGGVEEGEDLVEAARREITEETGYKNIRLVRPLGGPIEAFFYAAHKGVNRKVINQNILFELENSEKADISSSEKSQYDTVWLSPQEVVDSKLRHGEFDIIWKRATTGADFFGDDGVLINSPKFDGLKTDDAKKTITEFVGGKLVTKYKLRDWVFSRQRYWGEPIPVIHCEKCGVVPVPEKDLPVKLPEVKHYEPTGTGGSPLAAMEKWVNVKCPRCGGRAKRETNTMPQWAGSSWYYLRYMDPKNKRALVVPEKEKYWAPVDVYVGGAEHAARHLIYARFWHKFLHDIGTVSTTEPFTRFHYVGLILAEDGKKMSKRYGNVINPDDIVETYGADTLRVYEMFMGPFSQSISWDTKSIIGSRRFIEKIWRIAEKVSPAPTSLPANTETLLHKTIKKVTEDIEKFNFNTAISAMMMLLNEIEKVETLPREIFETILKLVAPFAPHVAEELWFGLGNKKSIHISAWPAADDAKMNEENVRIAVQVNGRVRGEIEIAENEPDEAIKGRASELEIVKKWLEGRPIKKMIYVKGRLVNVVG